MTATRIGMITPSSNTIVEPFTSEIVRALPGVTAHFSRLTVTEISLAPAALDQFTLTPFLDAAGLLADARVDAIAWNGTSAAWKGFEQDDALCAALGEAHGVAATASMRALNAVLEATSAKRIGLVTPYLDEVQRRIVENYTSAGYTVTGERHSGLSENFAFAGIAPEAIAGMARAVAAEGPDAILVICTNLRSPGIIDALERELDLPVYDSLSTVVWHALRLAGVDARAAPGWGRLFDSPPF